MEKLLFTRTLVLTVGLISLLTGRNRRQVQKIPEGVAILCPPPGKRYVLYALGVVVVAVVAFFGVLYIMDGAPENARPIWCLCVGAAVLTLMVCGIACLLQHKGVVYAGRAYIQVPAAEKTGTAVDPDSEN